MSGQCVIKLSEPFSLSLPPSLLPVHSSIQGFMQRTDAEKMLLQSPSGTFLIRFSEGDPGGISVAWVNGEGGIGGGGESVKEGEGEGGRG